MIKHFVEFFSPGTFVAETTTKPIDSWNIAKAQEMASKVSERYGATPYGFQFVTRGRSDTDFDSKETSRSPMYYLHGRVQTLEEVRKRADPKESILLSNMECNGWDRIVTNTKGYKWTQPLNKGDVVLSQ